MNSTNIDNDVNEKEGDLKDKSYYNYYIYLIIGISIFFIIERFIINSLDSSNSFINLLQEGRDADFRIIYHYMDSGLINMYEDIGNLYLYFWYFLFFPFYLIPFEISVYIWDVLRLVSSIYIIKQFHKITDNRKDLIFFIIFNTIGFIGDSILNNTNWLVQFLLFESYLHLKKDNKLISGVFFTIATYKFTALIFPLVLLVVKKIKIKDLIYFYGPFFLICIPYVIFPSYFLDFFNNLSISREVFPFNVMNSFLKIFQSPHLLYLCLIALVIIVNMPNKKLQDRMRILLFILFVICLILVLIFISIGYVILTT